MTDIQIPHPFWIETLKGRPFDLQNPKPEMYDIEEIAHALSLVNRYVGHTPVGLSVAQHSELVSRLVPSAYKLQALLHDVEEAYLGDFSSPLLRLLRNHQIKALDYYRYLVRKIGGEAFGVQLVPTHEVVQRADAMMLAAEQRDLKPGVPLANGGQGWGRYTFEDVAHIARVVPWSPEESRERFLQAFHQYKEATF